MKAYDTLWGYCACDQWDANSTALHRTSCSFLFSLRDGWTAYAVLSREPSSLWPPSRSRKSPTPRRLTLMPPPQELDRSNNGQDHPVWPYARPAISPQFFQPRRRSRKLTDETNLTAPLA